MRRWVLCCSVGSCGSLGHYSYAVQKGVCGHLVNINDLIAVHYTLLCQLVQSDDIQKGIVTQSAKKIAVISSPVW